MPRPEDITEAQIKAFLDRRSLAALMAIEMGTDKNPAAMRRFVASAFEWQAESAPFDRAVYESSITRTGDMEFRINARDDD